MRVIGLWLLVSTGLCGVASSSDDSLSLLHRINDWEVFKVNHITILANNHVSIVSHRIPAPE